MPEPTDQPARHGRSLAGFYVALGAVAALVGLGAWLWKPLTLAYAIHRVEHTAYQSAVSPLRFQGVAVADKWLLYCLGAASSGNQQAMRVIIDHASVLTPPSNMEKLTGRAAGPAVAFMAAEAQSELFFVTLDRYHDEHVCAVLGVLLGECEDHFLLSSTGHLLPWMPPTPAEAASSFERVLELADTLPASDPSVRSIAQSALKFTRLRFARELAEAEKAAAKKAAP